MQISVITVCRNAAATIAGALESFLAQTHADKELIVVDGASTDDTLAVVRRFEREGVRVICEPDRGLYDAMNKGLAAFAGEAVGFLNADDRFADAGALAATAEALERAHIAFGDLDVVLSHEPRRVVRRWRTGPYRRGAFRRGWMPAHPTFYCRREVVQAVGAFDLRYRTAADYDFMLRAMELTDFEAARVGRVTVDMLHGGKSSSGLAAMVRHNLEALDSRRRRLGTGVVDYALFAKPLGKIGQLAVTG